MSETLFSQTFDRPAQVRASAPGRVNLMGEHTDYNGGLVLPSAIPQRTTVWLAARDDTTVRAASAAAGGQPMTYALGSEKPGNGWIDYLAGVTVALAGAGHALLGFDAWIASEVPIGSGLSSSAALEVAALRGLRDLFHLELDDVELARLGQRAETQFVGANVGIMDQMAASLADDKTALLLDTADLSYRRIPLPRQWELAVIDSGIRHAHAGGSYNRRRQECDEAARRLGVALLCQLRESARPRIDMLPPPLRGRALHVVLENGRVPAMARALEVADEAQVKALCAASHASQRTDFEVSLPELDRLVELAMLDENVLGARLTGGGFGGSVLLIARAGSGWASAERVVAKAGDARARVVLPLQARSTVPSVRPS